jgi:hypothetical protein
VFVVAVFCKKAELLSGRPDCEKAGADTAQAVTNKSVFMMNWFLNDKGMNKK